MIASFIEVGLKSSMLLLLVAAVHALLYRRTSAATRHLVWVLAVVGLLMLPILSAVLLRWNVAIRVAPVKALNVATVDGSTGSTESRDTTPAGNALAAPRAAGTVDPAPRTSIGGPASWASTLEWTKVLPALYAIGVCLFLGRLAAERWAAQRLARNATVVTDPEWIRLLATCARQIGVHRPVRLLRSREHTMPLAMGIRVPTIIVPAVADMWDEERRGAVLLHELAHVGRHDCLTQTLSAVACALYWAHPGAWWVARRLRIERELASDDRALAAGAHPRDYASHLLEIAYTCNGHRAPALVVSMASARSLEGRMMAVLDPARNRTTPTRRGVLAGVGIASALLVPVAAASAVAVPATNESELARSAVSKDAGIGDEAADPAQRDTASPVALSQAPGTWEIRRAEAAGIVYVRLAESSHSSSGFTLPLSRLDGLPPGLLAGAGGAAQFTLRREAGDFAFEGTFRSGVGAGTYTFIPNASFAAELVKRGFAQPTAADQYALARSDVGVAFVDELAKQGYARSDLSQLLLAATHGVSLDYLRELDGLGYRVGTVVALVKMADHGVSPQYIRELRGQGFNSLTADDLVRVRDHGVDGQYIKELQQLGFTQLSLEALVRTRDHGITPDYVRDLRGFGYRLSLEELITARDHGVDAQYIKDMRDLGYTETSMEALIGARDHGVTPDYIGELRQRGYRLTLPELIKARDHGVTPDYISGLATLGYEGVKIESLIRLRDHGVTPDFVRQTTRPGQNRLTIEELIRMRDGGNLMGPTLHKVYIYDRLREYFARWWN